MHVYLLIAILIYMAVIYYCFSQRVELVYLFHKFILIMYRNC